MFLLLMGCAAGGAAVAVAARQWRKSRRDRKRRLDDGSIDLLDLDGISLPHSGTSDFTGDQGSYSGGGAGGSWNLPIVGSLADFDWPDFTWPSIEFPDIDLSGIDFPDFDF